MYNYKNIIKHICKDNNICYKEIGEYIYLLTQNNKHFYIFSKRFSINSEPTSRIMDNKSQCYLVLNEHNIPSLRHIRLTNPNSVNYINQEKSSFEIAFDLFRYHKKIVIKPDNSYEGIDVFICDTEKDIEVILVDLFSRHRFLAVSPFVEIANEFRVVFLDGNCELIYKKIDLSF